MVARTPVAAADDRSSMEDWSTFARTTYENKYQQPGEEWADTAYRVASNVMGPYFPELVDEVALLITQRKFMPGGRYLYAAGREFNQTQNCLLMKVDDSREGWADLMRRTTSGLMTGAGVGIVYSDLRESGAVIKKTGGTSSGPLALMHMVNEAGRHIMQGGSRRSAIWAGLHWNHPDVMDFVRIKDWTQEIRDMKESNFNAVAPMDGTNVSVILDDEFFQAYHAGDLRAREVFWTVVNRMLKTGEPGFSVDVGENAGEHLRNACTEVTSADDNDICNLGSINIARIGSLAEFERIVHVSTAFLLAGTLYSKVPYEEVADTRTKNRRLGLGLMGLFEWLVVRGKPYAPDEELQKYLESYMHESRIAADYWADQAGVSRPLKVRAIAPTGTIGILAETTTGIEPMFAPAYKRRYLKGQVWKFQYVVDQTAKRLADKGVNPDEVDSAYRLASDPAKRLAFQAWVQQYVDHGISSTLNLPAFEDQEFTVEEFGNILLQYLPKLRGVTTYPDGARGGQPLNVVPYQEATDWEGFEYEEMGNSNACGPDGLCGV